MGRPSAAAGATAAVEVFVVVRAGAFVRLLAVFATLASLAAAGFLLARRVFGSMLGASVFRVVFAMNVVVPFLKRAAGPAPARCVVQRQAVVWIFSVSRGCRRNL
jgi:hypothetical protein